MTVTLIKTALVLQTFFFRMQEHPEIQRQAQAELDAIVGRDRLPTFSDKAELPFVDALCKELLRHTPAVPGGTRISYPMKIQTRSFMQSLRYAS